MVFEGHPSWRALLSFYLGGIVVAVAVAVVIALLAGTLLGLVAGAAVAAVVIVFGLLKAEARAVDGEHLGVVKQAVEIAAASASSPRVSAYSATVCCW